MNPSLVSPSICGLSIELYDSDAERRGLNTSSSVSRAQREEQSAHFQVSAQTWSVIARGEAKMMI